MSRLAVAAAVLTVGLAGCGGSSAPATAAAPAAPSLMSSLQSAVPGLTEAQANTGVGAILGYAKTKMPADQYLAATKAIPNADKMVSDATKLGMPSEMTGLSSLRGTLEKAGISQEQFSQMVPVVAEQVSKVAGPKAGQALLAAFK